MKLSIEQTLVQTHGPRMSVRSARVTAMNHGTTLDLLLQGATPEQGDSIDTLKFAEALAQFDNEPWRLYHYNRLVASYTDFDSAKAGAYAMSLVYGKDGLVLREPLPITDLTAD